MQINVYCVLVSQYMSTTMGRQDSEQRILLNARRVFLIGQWIKQHGFFLGSSFLGFFLSFLNFIGIVTVWLLCFRIRLRVSSFKLKWRMFICRYSSALKVCTYFRVVFPNKKTVYHTVCKSDIGIPYCH